LIVWEMGAKPRLLLGKRGDRDDERDEEGNLLA